MRTVDEIEEELRGARRRCEDLEDELNAAQLQDFLLAAGVPEGARPIFVNRKGERVLVNGFDCWPRGSLIKKDGTVSHGTVRVLYDSDEYQYVGE